MLRLFTVPMNVCGSGCVCVANRTPTIEPKTSCPKYQFVSMLLHNKNKKMCFCTLSTLRPMPNVKSVMSHCHNVVCRLHGQSGRAFDCDGTSVSITVNWLTGRNE